MKKENIYSDSEDGGDDGDEDEDNLKDTSSHSVVNTIVLMVFANAISSYTLSAMLKTFLCEFMFIYFH